MTRAGRRAAARRGKPRTLDALPDTERSPGASASDLLPPDPFAASPHTTTSRRPDPALYRRDWSYALWQILASMGEAFVPRFPEEFGDDPHDHRWQDDSGWSDAR